MDDINQQNMDMRHKQACINLERATQFITQALEHEVGRNREFCMLIRRLEERKVETERSLTEHVQSNRQLTLKIEELQKLLEEKDNSLTLAHQTVALLENELKDLYQQFQTQESTHRTFQKVNECLQDWESHLKVESSLDFSDSERLESPVVEIKEEAAAENDGCGEYRQPAEETHSRTEYSICTDIDMKTELIQEKDEQKKSNRNPVVSPETHLSSTEPVSLAQFKEVSVVLVDCSWRQEQRGTDEEDKSDDQRKGTSNSSTSPPSGTPDIRSVQQTSPSSISPTTETEERFEHVSDVCKKTFLHSPTLGTHRHVNMAGMPYTYSLCGENFTVRTELLDHVRLHSGEKQYLCTTCGKTFTTEVNLKRHQWTHTGKSPHTCGQCNKSFTRRLTLLEHLRVHTGEKPHQCATCGKRFAAYKNLRTHQWTHTGWSPHTCAQCGKGFPRRDRLEDHQRSHSHSREFSTPQQSKGST
ncbi:zinc finger protein 615-like isoform X1 [Alosa sapidissima]|uniref:zinc finger protein 615-like isoform X1 n=1 Tax=Alosa sapidissima TaxID=34773 RepID=UPI001C08A1AF|nr:zinc finger protein 615-like isoform X1 [Alosa sapidissima]XP_041953253.1 zinc finger protein 615-like isoform X1 [Alosa sapidissima]